MVICLYRNAKGVATMTTTSSQQHHCQRPGCTGILRSEESRARGTSKRCAKMLGQRIAEAKEGFKPEQVAKAEAAIVNGDVTENGHGLYLVKSTRSSERYCSDGLSCTCPAGAHDRQCLHLLAVRIFEILTRAPKAVRPLWLAA
jgi:hypothetical protein